MLGYYICKNWGLSSNVENVVRWHHEFNRANRNTTLSEESHDIIDVVILANWVVHEKNFGFSGNHHFDDPSESFLNRINLVPNHLPEIQLAVENDLKLTKDFCDLLDSNS